MKHLVSLFAVIMLLSACKKVMQEELLQSNIAAGSSNIKAATSPGIAEDLQPVPYTWGQLTIPSDLTSPVGQNKIIQVNGETFCLVDAVNAIHQKVYKFNNSTKKWERSNDAFAERSNYRYWFSYQTKIYFGGGGPDYNKLISVDVVTLAVDTLANFPGTKITLSPACFVIGNKGYLTSGYEWISNIPQNHLWEYNFSTNRWVNKGNSPLGARAGAIAMVVDNKAYMGLGYEEIILNGQKINLCKNDWILYDPSSAYSIIKASFPGGRRAYPKGFVIGSTPYVGFGAANFQTEHYNNDDNCLYDLWKYNPSSNTWSQQANYPGGHTGWWRYFENNHLNGFSIGSTGYVTLEALQEFWKFTNSPY